MLAIYTPTRPLHYCQAQYESKAQAKIPLGCRGYYPLQYKPRGIGVFPVQNIA
ncbi:hypothetical protein J6590_087037 [Homalodisca vitripennis]|nr:hypothetical protein J6590_087037 [Homalodisca vitripennis]